MYSTNENYIVIYLRHRVLQNRKKKNFTFIAHSQIPFVFYRQFIIILTKRLIISKH